MQDPRTVPYVKCNNGSTTLITPGIHEMKSVVESI